MLGNKAHVADLIDIQDELKALVATKAVTAEAVEGLDVILGYMMFVAQERTAQESTSPIWLAREWSAEGRIIITDNGDVIANAVDPSIAEYIIATHHTFRDIPYAGGQLEIKLK